MAMYSKVEYWDERYHATTKGPQDWYQSYKSLRHILNPIQFAAQRGGNPTFPSRDQCRVLILGCGNSSFAEDMMHDGWTGPIVNVDFSSVVIEQMQRKYQSFDNLQFVCCDMTQELPFQDESFDLIVCKGSFDAVLCSAGSVANIRHVVSETARLLSSSHGVFFLVTHGNPDSRIVFLEHENDLQYYWSGVSIHNVPRPETHKTDFVYICRKRMNIASLANVATGKENATDISIASSSTINAGNTKTARKSG